MRYLLSGFLALSAFGQDCAAYLERARQTYSLKQYSQAAREFEFAAGRCPQRAAVLLDLARARFMAQEFELADTVLQQLLEIDRKNAPALKLRGDVLYLLARDKEAEQLLLQAAALDPANPEPPYALGRIYYQQSRFQEAIDQFGKVLTLDPKSYRAYDNMGLAYEGMNDTKLAMQSYEKALALVHTAHPEYDWVYGNMANLLYKLGDYRRAFQFGAEAANRNPNSARNFFLTGKALAKLERWELAAKWLGNSVNLDPKYSEARYQYATVLRKLGRNDEAQAQLKAFREITASQPRNRR